MTQSSGKATAALILGILAFPLGCVGVGLILGILALVLGIVARKEIDRAQGQMTGRGRARAGAILGGISLVVVPLAVVAILVTALGAARAEAQRVKCLANLRQIAQASALYADEHKQQLPFANSERLETRGDANGRRWTDAGWLYDRQKGFSQPGDVQNGALYTYMGSRAAYRCPMDPGPAAAAGAPIRNLTSYLINGAIDGYDTQLPPYRLAEFRSDSVMFWEPDEARQASWNDGSGAGDDVLTPRHAGGGHVVGFDLHVAPMTVSQWNAEAVRTPGRIWCNPASSSGR